MENKALFLQLTELRGRLVALTNEKAEVTDKYQIADSKATKMQKELEKLKEVIEFSGAMWIRFLPPHFYSFFFFSSFFSPSLCNDRPTAMKSTI